MFKLFENVSDPNAKTQHGLESKKRFLFGLSILIVAVTLITGVYGYFSETNYGLVWLGIATVVIFTAMAAYIRVSNQINTLSILTTIFALCALLYVFYHQSTLPINLIWMPIFPIIAFFLMGRVSGVLWSCIFLVGLITIILLSKLNILAIYYSINDIVIAFSTICLSIFALYYYQEVSENAFNSSEEKTILLESTANKLREENTKRSDNEKKLAHSIEQSDRSRLAMINLLEDEKELESELRREKASVEQTVEQRTKQLKEERAKLISSINSLRSGFIITDDKANVETINDYAKHLFFLSKENISILNSHDVLSKDYTIEELAENLKDYFPLRQHIQNALDKKETLIFKDVLVKNKHLDFYIAPIIVSIPNLEIIGTVVTVHDITEAKILERSRDEFFSIASHELRTPLTAIRGNSSLIESYFSDKISDPDLKEMVGDIHESSIRLLGIVNDFLNVSRLEQKRMVYSSDQFSLRELVDKTIKELEKTVKGGVKLSVEENTKLPNISADSNKVQEVLINLVGNAVKFTEKGHIKVKLEQIDDMVKVSIEDSGKGISDENSSLLFHKFQQAGTSTLTRDSTRGTGLGLYISRMMVEGMGGKIGIESSTPGKGSTFVFTLPLRQLETNSSPMVTTTSAVGERV